MNDMIKVPREWFERLLEHVERADAVKTVDPAIAVLIGYASTVKTLLDLHKQEKIATSKQG